MTPILEDQCNNLEFVLTRDPTFVTYKLDQNQVPADVYFPWIRTKREWVQCVPDPQQHVVFHGFDGRGHRSVSKSQNMTEAWTAHIITRTIYSLSCKPSLFIQRYIYINWYTCVPLRVIPVICAYQPSSEACSISVHTCTMPSIPESLRKPHSTLCSSDESAIQHIKNT